MSFESEVTELRAWISEHAICAESGEWECEYPAWPSLWKSAIQFAIDRPVPAWNADQLDALLFAIARDNEDEAISQGIAEHPDVLIAVTAAALDVGDTAAKWQLAARLGELTSHRNDAIRLLVQLAADSDEYVRRRAMLACGNLSAPQAEQLAESAWASGLEYQRIAAIHVLAQIGSPAFEENARLVTSDGRESVVNASARARAEL